MTTNYISIKSILYDLSLTIDDRYWNENKMLQWLIHGVRQINLISMLEPKVTEMELSFHKTKLPSNLKYLVQVAYSPKEFCNPCCDTCPPSECNSCVSSTIDNSWAPLRLSSSPFHSSILLNSYVGTCRNCFGEYSVSSDLTLLSNLESGTLLVSYLAYPVDSSGDILIPDDETLKEALLHYVLYRYWMSKYQMKEEGSESRVKFHLDMWGTLSKKAKNLNAPDTGMMENLMQIWNNLVPRSNRFEQMFLTLSHP